MYVGHIVLIVALATLGIMSVASSDAFAQTKISYTAQTLNSTTIVIIPASPVSDNQLKSTPSDWTYHINGMSGTIISDETNKVVGNNLNLAFDNVSPLVPFSTGLNNDDEGTTFTITYDTDEGTDLGLITTPVGITDKAGPAFKAFFDTTDTILIVFNEPVSGDTAIADWHIDGTDVVTGISTEGRSTATTATLNSEDMLTLTVTSGVVDTDTFTVFHINGDSGRLRDSLNNMIHACTVSGGSTGTASCTKNNRDGDSALSLRPLSFTATIAGGDLITVSFNRAITNKFIKDDFSITQEGSTTAFTIDKAAAGSDIDNPDLLSATITTITFQVDKTVEGLTGLMLTYTNGGHASIILSGTEALATTTRPIVPNPITLTVTQSGLQTVTPITISGTSTPGAEITLSKPGTSFASVVTTVMPNGTWSFSNVALTDGANNFELSVTHQGLILRETLALPLDNTPPSVSNFTTSRTSSGDRVIVTISEPVSGETQIPDWRVGGVQVTDVTPKGNVTNETMFTLTIPALTGTAATPSVNYNPMSSGRTLEDRANKALVAVTQNARDGIPPTFTAIATSTTQIVITTSERTSGGTAHTQWEIDIPSTSVSYSATSATRSGSASTNIVLVLNNQLPTGINSAAKVTYGQPSSNILQDNNLDNAGLLFNSATDLEAPLLDGIAPVITSIETAIETGTEPPTFSIVVRFSEGLHGSTDEAHWIVQENTVIDLSATTLSDTTRLDLTLMTALAHNATPTITYMPPGGTSTLRDRDDMASAVLLAAGSSDTAADKISPRFAPRITDLREITIDFSEPVRLVGTVSTWCLDSDGTILGTVQDTGIMGIPDEDSPGNFKGVILTTTVDIPNRAATTVDYVCGATQPADIIADLAGNTLEPTAPVTAPDRYVQPPVITTMLDEFTNNPGRVTIAGTGLVDQSIMVDPGSGSSNVLSQVVPSDLTWSISAPISEGLNEFTVTASETRDSMMLVSKPQTVMTTLDTTSPTLVARSLNVDNVQTILGVIVSEPIKDGTNTPLTVDNAAAIINGADWMIGEMGVSIGNNNNLPNPSQYLFSMMIDDINLNVYDDFALDYVPQDGRTLTDRAGNPLLVTPAIQDGAGPSFTVEHVRFASIQINFDEPVTGATSVSNWNFGSSSCDTDFSSIEVINNQKYILGIRASDFQGLSGGLLEVCLRPGSIVMDENGNTSPNTVAPIQVTVDLLPSIETAKVGFQPRDSADGIILVFLDFGFNLHGETRISDWVVSGYTVGKIVQRENLDDSVMLVPGDLVDSVTLDGDNELNLLLVDSNGDSLFGIDATPSVRYVGSDLRATADVDSVMLPQCKTEAGCTVDSESLGFVPASRVERDFSPRFAASVIDANTITAVFTELVNDSNFPGTWTFGPESGGSPFAMDIENTNYPFSIQFTRNDNMPIGDTDAMYLHASNSAISSAASSSKVISAFSAPVVSMADAIQIPTVDDIEMMTMATMIAVRGTAEPGSALTIYRGNTVVVDVMTPASGAYNERIDLLPFPEPNAITVRSVDGRQIAVSRTQMVSSDGNPPRISAEFSTVSGQNRNVINVVIDESSDITTPIEDMMDGFSIEPFLGDLTVVVDPDRKTITITTTDERQKQDYELSYPSITDNFGNTFSAGSITIVAADIFPPELVDFIIHTGRKFVTLVFDEPVTKGPETFVINVVPHLESDTVCGSGPSGTRYLEPANIAGNAITSGGFFAIGTGANYCVQYSGIADLAANHQGGFTEVGFAPNEISGSDTEIPDNDVLLLSSMPDLRFIDPDMITVKLLAPISNVPTKISPNGITLTVEDGFVRLPASLYIAGRNLAANANELVISTQSGLPSDFSLDTIAPQEVQDDIRDRLANDRPLVLLFIGDSERDLDLYPGATASGNRQFTSISLPNAPTNDGIIVFTINNDNMLSVIDECPNPDPTVMPDASTTDFACYQSLPDGGIQIWTNHFSFFGVLDVREIRTGSGGDGCDDCTPPTLGVDKNGIRLVSGGFTYNDDTIDVLYYYTPLPLIEVEVGDENIAQLRIFEDSGQTRIRHAGLAFGLSSGNHFAESEAEIRVDIPFRGMPMISVDDPYNAIDRDTLRVTTEPGSCMESSTAECLVVTIHHTFLEPLDFNVVSTIIWDERLNSWQNFFNHGVEVTGESLNPKHGIEVNGGTLTLYPLIESYLDEDDDGIYDYDKRHVTYMVDEDYVVYRLTVDGTYEPVRNLYAQLHDVDDSMYDYGKIPQYGILRESRMFDDAIKTEREIALSILESMGLSPEPAPVTPSTSLYGDSDAKSRMEALKEAIQLEADLAEKYSLQSNPGIYKKSDRP